MDSLCTMGRCVFFFSSRRRHTRLVSDWSSDVCSSDLGLPTKIVSGYKGTADVRLAADAGEVAGGCWQWESMKVNWRSGLDSGDVVIRSEERRVGKEGRSWGCGCQ